MMIITWLEGAIIVEEKARAMRSACRDDKRGINEGVNRELSRFETESVSGLVLPGKLYTIFTQKND